MNDDGLKSDEHYQQALERSMAESREQRGVAPLPNRLAGPPTPSFAGASQVGNYRATEPVILGAIGGGGVFQIQPTPRQSEAIAINVATFEREFALYNASTSGTLKVGVRFGIVRPYVSVTGLAPWPGDYTSGGGYKYEFTVSASGVAWIEVVNDTSGDTDKVSAINMGHGTSVPDDTSDTGYLPLGVWTVVSGALTIEAGGTGLGNQMYDFCGGAHYFGPL